MSGDTCLCPASGTKPKLSGFKGGGLGNKYVQLNVGGSLYYTTVRALTRHDTMLKAMFSGRMEVLTDKEGWILIDRCGKHFGTILNYLRDDTIILPQNRQEIKELMAEAKYYLIQGLVSVCQTALQDKKDSYQPVCNIPIITSLKEEERLIESSTKQLGRPPAEKHRAVRQALPALQRPRALHQGRHRGRDLLLVLLRPGPQAGRGVLHLHRVCHGEEADQGGIPRGPHL
uniref:BTB/POZ domain-containing adapter for CUL3-mediated RhoA degradation protein 2 n=1 Tax=Ursus maritimus TaxID=29073 RepID=A0A452U6R6_URSMA